MSSIPVVGYLRWGRLFRIVRILRVLRAARSTRTLTAYLLKRRAQGTFAAAALASILMVMFGSMAILHVEKTEGSRVTAADDAVWWAFLILTGESSDPQPATTEGRVVAAALLIAGMGLFATFTGYIASWFLAPGEMDQEDELRAIRQELVGLRGMLEDLKSNDTPEAAT